MGGAALHFSAQNYLPWTTTLHSSSEAAATSYCTFKFTFPALPPPVGQLSERRVSVIRTCSRGDVSAETKPSDANFSDETTVEVRKEPFSLISALNVEKALRGIAITEVDHYGRLGLNRGCSYDQVSTAYKNKVGELNNQGLEEEEFAKNLELLKESYFVLSTVEERRLYDWSLTRSEKPDEYMWPFEVDITQTDMDRTTPPLLQEPEDVGPTRLVGYSILGWLVLSFALSIILNR